MLGFHQSIPSLLSQNTLLKMSGFSSYTVFAKTIPYLANPSTSCFLMKTIRFSVRERITGDKNSGDIPPPDE
jgi:hypothetical protein